MKRKEKAILIQKILDSLYPDPKIPLDHKDAYTFLIAVLLSQQCTDARVNKISPLLFKRADAPEKMVKLSCDEIEEIIRPCGLAKNKAKAILNLSKILIEKYSGSLPSTFEDLEALPGVGHKTASVVMGTIFSQPAFPVDTHIHRSAKRWGLSQGKNVRQTEEDLKKLFPKKTWLKIHLQIIYVAREFCTARNHRISLCPICAKLQDVPFSE